MDGSQGPRVTNNDGCTLLLTWHTNAVCVDEVEPIDCVVFNDEHKMSVCWMVV